MNRPIVQGWCPGALRPMLSGDGLLVRVRLYSGRLPAMVALRLAELSEHFGNGLIDLSVRGNLQLRGVTETKYKGLVTELDALGLIDADATTEAMRNLLVTPFWTAEDGAQEIAAELEARLGEFPALPGKFGYAVDTGVLSVLRGASADVRIERVDERLVVRAEGMKMGAAVTVGSAVDAVLELCRWFVDSGGVSGGRGRMASLIKRGAVPDARFQAVSMADSLEFVPRLGRVAAGVLVGFEFGQMRAKTLAALARLGDMRLTPWRMVLLERAEMPDVSETIIDSDDPALRVVACTGAPACLQGLRPVRDVARRLAAAVPIGKLLHVSGCTKGCAHPTATDVTLVATAMGFNLIQGRTAADSVLRHVTVHELLAQPELLTEAFNAS